MPRVPQQLVKVVFDKPGLCNEFIRSAYARWAEKNGFRLSGDTWEHPPDGSYIRLLKNSGVIVSDGAWGWP